MVVQVWSLWVACVKFQRWKAFLIWRECSCYQVYWQILYGLFPSCMFLFNEIILWMNMQSFSNWKSPYTLKHFLWFDTSFCCRIMFWTNLKMGHRQVNWYMISTKPLKIGSKNKTCFIINILITCQEPRIFQRSLSKIKWKQMWNIKLLSNWSQIVIECTKNCVALDWCIKYI